MDDDLVFPMSSRLSCTTGASSILDITRPQSELDISPMGKHQSSSSFSVNTQENISGIPPHFSQSTYKNQRVSKCYCHDFPLITKFRVNFTTLNSEQ